MKKQHLFIISSVLLFGLLFAFFQYYQSFKTEDVSAVTIGVPNPGHAWSLMECSSDTLCIDETNKRLGVGTASPTTKLYVAGGDIGLASLNDGNIRLTIQGNSSDGKGHIFTSGTYSLILNENGGNVGIGTTSPTFKLSVAGNERLQQTAGNEVLLDMYQAGTAQWGISNPASIDRLDFAEDGSPKMTISSGGNVGIGTTSPGYKLTVAGTAWVTSGSWSGSDIRWKKNVSTLSTTSSLDKILKLNPVTYKWKTDEYPEMNFSDGSQLGFIAQDVENIIPEVVTTDNNGYKGISYEKIVPVLTSAIQEQQKEIDNLSNENKLLKKLICLDHPSAEVCK